MLGLDKGLTQGAASHMFGGLTDRTRDVLGPPFKLTISASVIAEPQDKSDAREFAPNGVHVAGPALLDFRVFFARKNRTFKRRPGG
jgi:hypothetical protein